MGLGKRSKEPTGLEKFANCNMKEVRSWGNATHGNGALKAALFCPRSEDGATEISGYTAEANIRRLSEKAAELLCGKCPFGSLDRIAGEELRIAEIQASLERINKQRELAVAQADYEELQRTIASRVEAVAGQASTAATVEQPPLPDLPEAEPPTPAP